MIIEINHYATTTKNVLLPPQAPSYSLFSFNNRHGACVGKETPTLTQRNSARDGKEKPPLRMQLSGSNLKQDAFFS